MWFIPCCILKCSVFQRAELSLRCIEPFHDVPVPMTIFHVVSEEVQLLTDVFFLLAQVLHWLWVGYFTHHPTHYLSPEEEVPLQDRAGAGRGMGTWAVFVSHQCAS